MVYAALIMLAITCLITGLAVFTYRFHDNFFQRCGLIVICLGSMSYAWRIYSLNYVSYSALTIMIGLALFSIGSMLKALRSYHYPGNERRYGFRRSI